MKYLAIILAVLCVAAVATAAAVSSGIDSKMVRDVQSGESILTCLFRDGYRAVPAEKVTGFEHGYWTFDNGAASSCSLEKAVKS